MRASSAGRRGLTLISITMIGCTTAPTQRTDALWRTYRDGAAARTESVDVVLASGDARLDRTALIRAVLARNPSIDAAREALRIALADIRQATALDDPMVGYEVAPLSVVGDANVGHVLSVRQKLPYPGKRRLAGQAALAMAEVEAAGIEGVRIELAQTASELFDDYYFAARALEINAQHEQLLEQMKKSAEAQYVVGRAAQQDPIQAEVELAQLARERLMLESERDQIVSRLNGLLHRAPVTALPSPPAELVVAAAPAGTSAELQALALQQRPQRAAASARIRAARAKEAIAGRAFYPDLEVSASYNSMWDMPEHRWMIGVMVELPLQRGRRHAAVDQADAEADRARFEEARLLDEIRVEVDRAHRRVVEAEALVAIHNRRLVPAARARLESARAGFTAAQNAFVVVVEAQKSLRDIELSLASATAELSRRRALLARAVGVLPVTVERGER